MYLPKLQITNKRENKNIMKKKITCYLLAGIMSVAVLSGCRKTSVTENDNPQSESSVEGTSIEASVEATTIPEADIPAPESEEESAVANLYSAPQLIEQGLASLEKENVVLVYGRDGGTDTYMFIQSGTLIDVKTAKDVVMEVKVSGYSSSLEQWVTYSITPGMTKDEIKNSQSDTENLIYNKSLTTNGINAAFGKIRSGKSQQFVDYDGKTSGVVKGVHDNIDFTVTVNDGKITEITDDITKYQIYTSEDKEFIDTFKTIVSMLNATKKDESGLINQIISTIKTAAEKYEISFDDAPAAEEATTDVSIEEVKLFDYNGSPVYWADSMTLEESYDKDLYSIAIEEMNTAISESQIYNAIVSKRFVAAISDEAFKTVPAGETATFKTGLYLALSDRYALFTVTVKNNSAAPALASDCTVIAYQGREITE
jgi:hypothetical protein